jgi:hypothetical protein
MTEHDQGFTEDRRRAYTEACKNASTDKILIVPGIEYSDPANAVHILTWGSPSFLGTGIETQRLLEMAADNRGITVFAHPSRRAAWRTFKKEWTKHLTGIELWNRKTDGWAPSTHARNLIEETGALSFVGLDFHSPKQFFPMATIMNIEGSPNERTIIENLRLGNFTCETLGTDLKFINGRIAGSTLKTLESLRRLAARTYRFASRTMAP